MLEANGSATQPILTIAVPTFNMERLLQEDLASYADQRLREKLEVLVMNNASEDRSREIALSFCEQFPEIFRLIDRDSRGYGGSINQALALARGQYFRIVDADDWVNTEELLRQINLLEHCEADVVLSDYCVVSMSDGSSHHVAATAGRAPYNTLLTDLRCCCDTLPCIHSTTYRTQLLRGSGFFMQDRIFFVDEEYVVLPYLSAKSVCYTDCDVYRYRVDNPAQSTSPKNRAKLQSHREQILKRLIAEVGCCGPTSSAEKTGGLSYCRDRITKGVGDHFTTLYMYVEERNEGRRLAEEWKRYLLATAPEYWHATRKKAAALQLLNRFHISLTGYARLKRLCGK